MAVLLAQLPGPINLRLVLSDLKLTDILHDLITAKGNRSGVPRVLAVDRNETRELAGTLHIEAPGVPAYSYTANIIPAMTSNSAPSGVASASEELGSGYAAWKAFNHSNVGALDGWCVAVATGQLQYQFPAAHVFTRYAITSRDAGGFVTAPKTWTFQGSNDGVAWTTLDTQTNVTDWATAPNVRKVFDIANATAYAYGRLDITEGNTAGYVGVGELEMMETMISGYSSGKNDAIAKVRAINRLVTVGTTLTLQSTGATNAVTLKVLPSRGVSQPLDELFELDGAPVLASCAFSFTCEPYAYGPETILLNGAGITAPCIVDLGTVPGDYPAPLSLQFVTNATGFHAIYCSLIRPGSPENLGNFLREAEGFAWSGAGTGVTAPAYAHDGAAECNESVADATGEVQDGCSDGTYLIMARCRMGADAAGVGIVKPFTGQWAWPAGTDWDYYELGHGHLPTSRVQYAQVSHHTVTMNAESDVEGHAITMDYLGFMPTSWGHFRWHPPARSDYATKLDVYSDGSVYVADRSSHAHFKGAPISCVGPSKLVIFAEENLQAAGCAMGLTALVTPRYALWA